jgi:hypothetical protein
VPVDPFDLGVLPTQSTHYPGNGKGPSREGGPSAIGGGGSVVVQDMCKTAGRSAWPDVETPVGHLVGHG